MDIKSLSTLVIEKLKDANMYSELDDKALFKAVYGYLDMIYQKHFHLAQKRIKSEEQSGIFPNEARYKKAYDGVEDTVMIYANKLAAVTKEQI